MMQKNLTSILICVLFIINFGSAKERSLRITVSNPLLLDRKSETIAVKLSDLKAKLSSLDFGRVTVVDAKTKANLLNQVTSDELLFQSDFKSRETKTFLVQNGPAQKSKPASLVDGRFVKPREDYAWENDRIAFRMYGPAMAKDVNNGIDVWTKRVRYLIVEKWYKGDEDTGAARVSYHIDHGEGADFFSVGKTLGAGSCGIWYNNAVHQPGVFSSYKTVLNGPIRLVFELTYDTLNVAGKMYKEIKRVTLDAGQNLNRIDVTYFGPNETEELQFVAGLVKRKSTASKSNEQNAWMSLWGATNDDTTNGSLGSGVVMMKSEFVGLTEDKDQFLMIGKTKPANTATYYTGAGWTRSGDFATEDEWTRYLNEFALRFASPLRVKLSAK
ncbi:MAG: DUF4861 family protein [Ignavibacteriae bacterium]|nr:DUF4861 family protein [Ignavibacteriota bacterium]